MTIYNLPDMSGIDKSDAKPVFGRIMSHPRIFGGAPYLKTSFFKREDIRELLLTLFSKREINRVFYKHLHSEMVLADDILKVAYRHSKPMHKTLLEKGAQAMTMYFFEVKDVLAEIEQGKSHQDLCKNFPGISASDIKACLAWQARFRPEDMKDTFNRVSNEKFFLLDENQSYFMLPDVVRLFGRATHVYAEGLYDMRTEAEKAAGIALEKKCNDDMADVWAHAVWNKYKAVLTQDRDFISIVQSHRANLMLEFGKVKGAPIHTPVVIFTPQNGKKGQRADTISLLRQYQDQIRAYANDNDCAYALMSKSDFSRRLPDADLLKTPLPEPKKPHPRRGGQPPAPQ